jgi:Tfp pilus assembly protein PilN
MINLIPDNVRTGNRYAARNVRLLRYTAVSLATMLIIVAITGLTILSMKRTESDLQEQSAQENTRIASFKSLQAQGQQLADQIATINSLLSRQVTFSGLLPQIAQIMPPGAVLKELDLSTSDILPASGTTSTSTTTSSTQKPFLIQAAVKDRSMAVTLLENIKATKSLFTNADIVSITESATGTTDANSLPPITQRYPYQVTINAYLKKISLTTSSLTTNGGTTR